MCKQVYFWTALCTVSLLALAFAIPYILLSMLLRRDLHQAARDYIYYYGVFFWCLVHPIMPVSIENPDFSPINTPCILILNHQSFLDIYALSVQKNRNIALVVRSWPFRKLFFFAPFMYLAQYVNAEDGPSDKFVERCAELLRQGVSIACFPEGTRSRSGCLQPFYSGIFRVAAESRVPIVPMLLHNTGQICGPGSFVVRAQPVRISLLAPVYPDEFQGESKLHLRLKNAAQMAMEEGLTKKLK